MTSEEHIQQQIEERFPVTAGKFRLQRARRMWVEVPRELTIQFIEFMKGTLKFTEFCTLTGLDEGENLVFLYHIAQERSGIVLNIRVIVLKSDPTIPTITHIFPAAELSEREVEDLLGARVAGLAAGARYPLPDDWPLDDHPLLKSWKQKEKDKKPEVQDG